VTRHDPPGRAGESGHPIAFGSVSRSVYSGINDAMTVRCGIMRRVCATPVMVSVSPARGTKLLKDISVDASAYTAGPERAYVGSRCALLARASVHVFAYNHVPARHACTSIRKRVNVPRGWSNFSPEPGNR